MCKFFLLWSKLGVVTFILFFVTVRCSVNKANNKTCQENLTFKKLFFESINNLELYINWYDDTDNFSNNTKLPSVLSNNNFNQKKEIDFLSKYVKISNVVYGYKYGYTSKRIFLEDKKKWLEWYKKNKCDNMNENYVPPAVP